MSAPVRIIVVCLVLAGLIGLVALFLPSGPVAKDTPLMREISAMHQIGTKLRYYADEHQTLPGGEKTGKSVDLLVTSGVLSLDDATYIREHHIEFRGFDPSRIGSDIVVMETIFTNTKTPRRIVGYSDGSVVTYELQTRQ